MAGKQTVLVGGRENDWSKRDMYLSSAYNSTIADNLIGLTLGYTIMDQTLYVQHLETATNAGGATDKKATGVSYYGKFMDGMIAPIISYHKVGTARRGQYDIYTAAGLQVAAMNLVFEVDYLMLTQEKNGRNSLTAAANSSDAELKSIVAHVRYNHDNFKPFAKFIKEEGEDSFTSLISTNGALETERTSWELGLEYYPNKDEDFRYHVVYNSSESKETTGVLKAKHEDTKLFAGVAFGYNLLK